MSANDWFDKHPLIMEPKEMGIIGRGGSTDVINSFTSKQAGKGKRALNVSHKIKSNLCSITVIEQVRNPKIARELNPSKEA
jgi:hypothetical protein